MKKEEIDELLNDVEEKKKSIELELKSVELERERLAARLREYRKELKMSQQELANILGKNQTVISSWETGSGVPDANQLPKIAKLSEFLLATFAESRRLKVRIRLFSTLTTMQTRLRSKTSGSFSE